MAFRFGFVVDEEEEEEEERGEGDEGERGAAMQEEAVGRPVARPAPRAAVQLRPPLPTDAALTVRTASVAALSDVNTHTHSLSLSLSVSLARARAHSL
jgi:hypothetical protein